MTTADTVKNIQQDLTALVKNTVALGKIEAAAMAKTVGFGVALVGAAAYLAINAVSLLFVAGALGFFLLLQPDAPAEPQDPTMVTGALPLGFVIMAGILLLVAAPLGLWGYSRIKANRGVEQTKAEAQATVTAVKSAIERGKADVAVRLEYGDDAPAPRRSAVHQPADVQQDGSVAARAIDAR